MAQLRRASHLRLKQVYKFSKKVEMLSMQQLQPLPR
jgi:hypothetical protein